MGNLLLMITALIAAFVLHKCIALASNYHRARRTGFPVIVSPAPSQNPVWLVISIVWLPYLKRFLTAKLYDHFDVAVHGWEFRQNGALHRRLGRTFALVTPDECSLWSADPALGKTILNRRKDFVQSPDTARFMGIFGSNMLLSNGDDWQRQRRIIAPNLNERISMTVWNESCEQAESMLAYLLKGPTNKTLSGLRCLAINVLGRAGYGQHQAWTPQLEDTADEWVDARGAYFKTISLVADMLLIASLFPAWILKLPIWPPAVRSLGAHVEKMPSYTKQMLNEEREFAAEGSSSKDNLLNMLVRFSDQAKEGDAGTSGPSLSLTEDEISGNLFLFSAAGFDTTAHTMGFAVTLLAAYPEWQDWMREELLNIYKEAPHWKYEEVFPRCPRTLAVMHETLRLFGAVLHATRYVTESQQLESWEKVHTLVGPMPVFVSSHTIHNDPEIWGRDVAQFKPSRWIDSNGSIVTPVSGTFLPWSAGPRVCPGMKMSQVEFVATFATLFRSARCEPVVGEGEDIEEKRAELKALMEAAVCRLTLTVKDHDAVKLRWVSA